jgi:lipoprotein NlpI
MAKPMLVTLPFVLLLLDYWPLQRFQEIKPNHEVQTEVFQSVTSDKQKKKSKKKQAVKETLEVKKPADPEYKWSLIYPLLWEKVPLFVLAILSSIVTFIAQQKGGAVKTFESLPLVVRIGNTFVSYITYIGKMIWPSNLAVFYPYPKFLVPWQVLGSVFLFIAITLIVIWRAKKFPYLATGWLWYIGTVVPVIGIVQAGTQVIADRYTYIPLIGLFIMVTWGVPDLLEKWKYREKILLTSSALSILCLSIITWTQVGYWQNSITLYDHTLKVTDNNYLAYDNRGSAYDELGNHRQAIEDCNRAIEIRPGYADAYIDRGNAYDELGNHRQAIKDFSRAIEIIPGYPEAYYNRGNGYFGLGNYKQAIENYSRAIEIRPDYTEAYYNRGNAYFSLGNYKQAIENFDRAIEIKPGYAEAYFNRACVYINQGDNISGCRDARKACELGNCKLLEMVKGKGNCR